MSVKESEDALDHVIRPTLPWRPDQLTECGLPVADRNILTRDEFHAKVRRLGKTRTAMTTCITCYQTAGRWKDWATSPAEVMRRELPTWHTRERHCLLDAELRAIEALIVAHRKEFDDFLEALAATTDLTEQRAVRRRKVVGERRWSR